ncbi:MAG: hypothetical protein ACJ8AW_20860 [Rhodopila sp.]
MCFANPAMRRRLIICFVVAVSPLLLIPCSQARTPWGFIGSRVIGRVQQFIQQPKDDQPGFDVATVILKADAANVYATAVDRLRKNPTLHIVAEDAKARTVEFSNGARSAGITVSGLGTRLSQIVVASAIKPGEASATLRLVEGILHICQAMKVTCREQ